MNGNLGTLVAVTAFKPGSLDRGEWMEAVEGRHCTATCAQEKKIIRVKPLGLFDRSECHSARSRP